MELKDFLPTSDTVTIEIKHPKTGETAGFIEAYLSHTEEYTEAQYDLFGSAPRDDEGNIDQKTAAKITLQMLAARVKSWDFTENGEPVDTSRALEVFRKLPWVARQFQEGVDKAEDFT